MHKLYSRLIYTIISCFFGYGAFASSETNVIARLTKASQQPVYGYNAVSELAKVLSVEIHGGRLTLWSSANKELQILPSTLIDIEKANDMPLENIDNLFVYELWKEDKKEVDIVPIGFLLATRNKRNTDFTYGFVVYDDVKAVLAKSYVESGIRSSSQSNLEEVMEQMKYVYTIIQYGSQTVANNTLSEKIKNDVFNKKSIAYNKATINSRIVSYTVSRQRDESEIRAENANTLLNSLQMFMQHNVEEYLSVGGDTVINYIKPDSNLVKINKLEITGIWTKTATGLDFKLTGIKFFANAKPLQFVPVATVNRWNINPGIIGLEQYVINRNYYYTVTKINNKIINPDKEEQYRVLLNNGSWDKFEE